MAKVVSRGGSRWLLLAVLVVAGFVGLGLEGSRSAAEDGAQAKAVARDKVDDLLEEATPVASLSTETSKTYRRSDGTFVTRVFAQPKDGDSTLKPAADGGFTAEGDDATATFPATLAEPVKIRRGDAWVALELDGGQGAGRPDGSTITYGNALPGVDVRYRASNGAVGEDLHLSSSDAPSRYTFALTASSGVRATTQHNGTIALTDADGKRVFSLSPSYAFADRDRNATQKVTTTLSEADGGWRVTLSVDEQWLRDALARGPVTIDPTVELQGATKDCALTSDTPTLSFCSDDQLWIGWSGDHDHHSLIKWDLSAIPKDAVALWGDVGLYQPSAFGINVSKDLTLHRVTRDWTNGASWNTYDGTHAWTTPGGDFEATPAATATVPANHGGWTDWSATALVQHWVDGSAPNYGVAIQDKPGPHVTGEEDYYSTEGTVPAQAPELDIVWTTRTGKPDFYTFESQALDAKATAGVNAANGNLLLATNDITAPGTGLDLKLDHYHNSLADPAELSALGIRGTASLGRDVHLHAYDAQTIGFSRGDGVTLPFLGAATTGTTTTWGAPAELADATLAKNSSTNQYTLHLPAGLPAWPGTELTLTFDTDGKLLSVKNPAGNTIGLSYYSPGAMEYPALGGITDTNNAFWDVDRAYIGEERIVDITHPNNQHTVFGYLNTYDDYLTKVTAADNTTNKYAYDTSHRLKSITTPDGNVTLITYTSTSSKVASIIRTNNPAHTTGPTTTFTYSTPTTPCQSNNFDYTKTVVNRPDSTSTTYCANDHAQITYDTDNPTAAPSGEWRDLAGGVVNGRGSRSIVLNGTDAGAGIKTMALEEVGGSTLASATLPCDPRNALNPTACPHTAKSSVSFDPVVLSEGVHTFRQKSTDYAGNVAYSTTWTVEVRLERVAHATVYADGPTIDPAPASEEWAQLGTLNGRAVERGTITTRDDVACPFGSCAELRQRYVQGDGVARDDDQFVRYRGVSTTDERIEVASDMIQLSQTFAGFDPDDTGSTSNVVFPWQVLPPGAGSTYELYEETEPITEGGETPDDANGNEPAGAAARDVRVRLVLDAATKLPLRETYFAVDDNTLISRRIWTYESQYLLRRDLAADFFSVARPLNPGQDKTLEYTTPPDEPANAARSASNVTDWLDAGTGKSYEAAGLASSMTLDAGRLCEAERAHINLNERPLPNEIPAANGKRPPATHATWSVATYHRTVSGKCPADGSPALTIESMAAGTKMAEDSEHGYRDLTGTQAKARVPGGGRAVAHVRVPGFGVDVPVLDLGHGQRGAYLEREGTALIITGSFTPEELPSITSNLEG